MFTPVDITQYQVLEKSFDLERVRSENIIHRKTDGLILACSIVTLTVIVAGWAYIQYQDQIDKKRKYI
jgi:hypothetical protein